MSINIPLIYSPALLLVLLLAPPMYIMYYYVPNGIKDGRQNCLLRSFLGVFADMVLADKLKSVSVKGISVACVVGVCVCVMYVLYVYYILCLSFSLHIAHLCMYVSQHKLAQSPRQV